ncbi:phosphatidate cytidylyltransferase [Sulfurisoma sediminicola]|uniref:Phosphatidate cytidylyltransferase n=1 Tax=Sulfurisoma sediminicola TaxID=1381557 RepID=A0A497XDT9_9PROT|nr:phosphatidate cytidylyltransferase [Sulfurisoma sediminicola]RLJ65123.1 phosphatidate cytidylyltransferase [Sulfurisoma sediminicola]
MLKARVITALVLVAGLLVVLFLAPAVVAAAAFGLVAALAAWEWAGLMKVDKAGRVFYAGFVVISCLVAGYRPAMTFAGLWLLAAAFWLVLAPLWLRRRWPLAGNDFVGYAVGWTVIVPTWSAMVDLHGRSPWLLLAVMALVWVADIAAYFTGRAFGRRKLAPAISPGKTWEGAYGAVFAVLGYGAIVASTSGRVPAPALLLPAALVLVVLTAVSIVGDLFESLMKRQAEVKDSSQLLPGHGGILDRIDSLTATLPLVALVIFWTSP